MRRLVLFFAILACALAGCRGPAKRAEKTETIADLRDVGRPWPVLVGQFGKELHPVSHDTRGFTFTLEGSAASFYRLDYASQSLVRTSRGDQPPAATGRGPQLRLVGRESLRTLIAVAPGGQETVLSSRLMPLFKQAFALTPDGAGVAFYEAEDEGAALRYYDLGMAAAGTWRKLSAPPINADLRWSPDSRYLVEEADGKLLVYNREWGLLLGAAEGRSNAFAPGSPYLAYWRTDGAPGLIDLSSGAAWPLPPAAKDYRYLPAFTWSADGQRLFLQAEGAAGTEHPEAPFLLCLYQLSTGSMKSYNLTAPVDLRRYEVLLRVNQPEVGRLLKLIPQLKSGPLTALDTSGYLVGRGKKLALLNLEARLLTLQTFPEPVRDLYLEGESRRLVVVTGAGQRWSVYSWRLPESQRLLSVFPERRDLTLGQLRLGMTAAEVRALLGAPREQAQRRDPYHPDAVQKVWRYDETVATFTSGKLTQIILSSPDGVNGRGIQNGAPLADVYEWYGRPAYETRDYVSYYGQGEVGRIKAAFYLDPRRHVAAMLIAVAENMPKAR